MSDVVISVEHLSKRYTIRHQRNGDDGLRHAIHDLATAPLRWLRRQHGAWSTEHGAGLNGNGNGTASSAELHAPSSLLQHNGNGFLLPANGASPSASGSLLPAPGSMLPPTEDFWALKDVSFEVKQGEVVGIIGRSGAGKSTILKILSGITKPTSGRVRIHGRVASLLEVGTGFHPELTGRENIFVNGAILGMTRQEIIGKFDEIVAFAGIEKFLDTPARRYSTGMYVRLAFAVAAHLGPSILVVDEVLAVGDAEFQKKCIGKMHDVARDHGRTVLFVSHNMAAVSALCSRAVVLESGGITYNGAVSGAISHYNSGSLRSERYLDKSGPHIQRVRVSQPKLIVGILSVDVEFDSPWPLDPFYIGIVIYNMQESPIFGSYNWLDPEFKQTPVQSGVATLEIVDVPLHPGLYRVGVWLGEKKEKYDYLEDAAAFEFIGKLPFNHGLSAEVIGSVRVAGSWKIHPPVS